MSTRTGKLDRTEAERSQFASTCWTTVLEAAHPSSPASRGALESLCRTYWYPLYAYLRRLGYGAHESEDLTQDFFSRLIERNLVAVADPSRGRFRSFLMTAARNFASNERQKAGAEKRGGATTTFSIDMSDGESRLSLDPADELTPERLYDREWAKTLLDDVLRQLRDEWLQLGKQEQFSQLSPFLAGRTARYSYACAAGNLGISEGAAMKAASRLRMRFRELLRSVIAETVDRPEDVEDEIRHLFDSVSS